MAQKPAPYKIMNHDMAKPAYQARSQNFVLGITHWLLITLILSLGFGQLLRFDISGVPIYFHDILVVCILVLQGLTLKVVPYPQIQRREGQTLMVLGIKVFLFAMAIGWLRALSLYPVRDLLVPTLYSVRLLAYLALYFGIRNLKIHLPPSIFLFSGIITLVIGLTQYFFMPDMRIFQYLGWDDHLSRLTLPHFDPTFTAVMLALYVLSNLSYRSLYAVSYTLITTLAILLTYARSVWLSLALTFGYFMLKNKKYNYLIIGICLLVIPILILPKKFGEGTNLLRTFSITSRVSSDLSYIQDYKWDLLIGRGMNTLILDHSISDLPNHATGPNNSYLYLLLTSGVLGLVGWGIFMGSLYKQSKYKPMLVFFFLASLFNNVMFYPFALLWVLIVVSTKAPTSA